MRTAVHINDAGITLLDGGKILYCEPGFALVEEEQFTTGDAAFRQARIKPRRIQNRYWSDLTTEPLADHGTSHLSAADLVSRQLEQLAGAGVGNELVIAVPAYMSPQQLGLLLGIASELQLPVVALVAAAAAATRREYKDAVPLHVDISLHSTTLARLAQPGLAQVEKTDVLDGYGMHALSDAWLRMVSNSFVQQSRFDPLHTAETEQVLINKMAGWLSEAARNERVRLEIDAAGNTYEATIESLAFIGAAAPVYQQIASKLRALFRADEVPALQLTDRVARLPGLAEMLKARLGGEVFILEPGATARGALARVRDLGGTGDGVSLIRQLPWDQAAANLADVVAEDAHSGVPTHMLFGNTAYVIDASVLNLGAEPSDTDRAVVLDSAMPGVSRRHCSLQRVNGQVVIEDFSRYGTFLNGNRIDGSTVLQIGDSVRVGSPGYEFLLITTDEDGG
jgi:FHA domain